MTERPQTVEYVLRFGGHEWRVTATIYNGRPRISIWPCYAAPDGTMKPGRGGLQVPLDEAEPFIEAFAKAAQRLK
jgi:hypothetical protein